MHNNLSWDIVYIIKRMRIKKSKNNLIWALIWVLCTDKMCFEKIYLLIDYVFGLQFSLKLTNFQVKITAWFQLANQPHPKSGRLVSRQRLFSKINRYFSSITWLLKTSCCETIFLIFLRQMFLHMEFLKQLENCWS